MKLLVDLAKKFVEATERRDWETVDVLYTMLGATKITMLALPEICDEKVYDFCVALLAPIVYHPGGMEIENPQLKQAILYQRLKMALEGRYRTATDWDVVAYLYSYHLTNPGFDETQRLYICLSRQVIEFLGGKVPNDVKNILCGERERRLLEELKSKIFKKQREEVKRLISKYSKSESQRKVKSKAREARREVNLVDFLQ